MDIRQPREVAELTGAVKKNPQRYLKEISKNESPLGPPPSHLTNDAKTLWFEIQTYALPGVLTASEYYTVELLANLMAEYRGDPRKCSASKINQIISLLARLGMTPADRQKIPAGKKEDDEFDDL